MTKILPVSNLEPYFKIGLDIARTSPCIRRQYAAVIVNDGPDIYYEGHTNSRVGRCCTGLSCARTNLQILHGQRVEVGGEIHAETATLIKTGIRDAQGTHFILVGLMNGRELYGREVWPCHSCAMQVKFAGYDYIYIRTNKEGIISPVNVSQVIEEREAEWYVNGNT